MRNQRVARNRETEKRNNVQITTRNRITINESEYSTGPDVIAKVKGKK